MLAKALCQFFIRIVWIATAQPEQQFVRLVRPRCVPGHNSGSQALCTKLIITECPLWVIFRHRTLPCCKLDFFRYRNELLLERRGECALIEIGEPKSDCRSDQGHNRV